MLKKLGLPVVALAAMLFAVPHKADARVHFGVYVGGPAYPAYPAPDPYYNPYYDNPYDPYYSQGYYYDPYVYAPPVYSYPYDYGYGYYGRGGHE